MLMHLTWEEMLEAQIEAFRNSCEEGLGTIDTFQQLIKNIHQFYKDLYIFYVFHIIVSFSILKMN